jgi:hypothetical protein
MVKGPAKQEIHYQLGETQVLRNGVIVNWEFARSTP